MKKYHINKTHLLKNQITIAVLVAILVQSVVFGFLLISTGLFTNIAREPDQGLRSRLHEKEIAVSGMMNNMLMEGTSLKRQINEGTSGEEISTMLIESLNRIGCVSGIFYVNTEENTGAYFKDSAPDQYNINYGDIICAFGSVPEEKSVSLAKDWRQGMPEEEFRALQAYMENAVKEDSWVFQDDGSIYYLMHLRVGNQNHILGIEIGSDMVETWLRVDEVPYEGMQFALIREEGGRFYTNSGLPLETSDVVEGKFGRVWMMDAPGKENIYMGWKVQMQVYGHMEEDIPLYLGVFCKEIALRATMWQAVRLVCFAYMVSILISIIVSFVAVNLVLKPLKILHLRIQGQKAGRVHFSESGIWEIDNISQALNVMTKELEESYARYAVTMQVVEAWVGSIEYTYGESVVYVTDSVKKILDIPEEMYIGERGTKLAFWENFRLNLNPVEEMKAYTYTNRKSELCCVAFNPKEEETGIFCVITDKTAEFEQIVQLRFASEHDYLTKLYNASYLEEKGSVLLEAMTEKVNALLFCDLDNLKYINDTYGHSIGDHYIMGMAQKLKDLRERPGCIVARISGDEFAVLLTGFDSREEIYALVCEMYQKKHEIELPNGGKYAVKASIGIAYQESSSDTVEILMKRADEAMYKIKHTTKDGIGVYEEK